MSERPAGDGWALPGAIPEPETGPAATPLPASADHQESRARGDGWRSGNGLLDGDAAGQGVPALTLRPLTVADILDGAFGIVKARPARILLLSAVMVVPLYLFSAAVQGDASSASYTFADVLTRPEDPEVARAVEEDVAGWDEMVGSLAGQVLNGLVLVALAAAIAYMLGAWVRGRDAPFGELVGAVGRRAWPLVASYVLVHLAEAPGLLLCGVGGLFIMPLFVAVAPVIGAEGAGPLRAIRRAARLGSSRYWPTLGVSLLIGLVGVLLGLALGGVPTLLVTMFGWDIAWPLLALGQVMGGIVVTPFVAGATVLLYLDLRMRNEGLDLELAVEDVFPGIVA